MKIKSIVTFLFLVLTCSNLMGQKTTDLVGRWIGADIDNNKSEMFFTEDGFVSFTINKQTFGGKNFTIKGQKADLKYEMDSSKNPIWLDFIGYLSGEIIEKGRLKGIIRFIDEDNADILLNFENVRFDNFTEENNKSTIRVIRKK